MKVKNKQFAQTHIYMVAAAPACYKKILSCLMHACINNMSQNYHSSVSFIFLMFTLINTNFNFYFVIECIVVAVG